MTVQPNRSSNDADGTERRPSRPHPPERRAVKRLTACEIAVYEDTVRRRGDPADRRARCREGTRACARAPEPNPAIPQLLRSTSGHAAPLRPGAPQAGLWLDTVRPPRPRPAAGIESPGLVPRASWGGIAQGGARLPRRTDEAGRLRLYMAVG